MVTTLQWYLYKNVLPNIHLWNFITKFDAKCKILTLVLMDPLSHSTLTYTQSCIIQKPFCHEQMSNLTCSSFEVYTTQRSPAAQTSILLRTWSMWNQYCHKRNIFIDWKRLRKGNFKHYKRIFTLLTITSTIKLFRYF